ncbi:hypothetical protein JOD57_000786 [Geodermatophilus bullaregiensis]|nr:hypothetical protein [Geodermatophilus bullaregiensis]
MLPPPDRGRAQQEGGVITFGDYLGKLSTGDS